MKFEISKFNQRRRQRGAIPLEMLVTYENGDDEYVWMSQVHLRQNITEYGAHPELLRALECYRQKRLVESPEDASP